MQTEQEFSKLVNKYSFEYLVISLQTSSRPSVITSNWIRLAETTATEGVKKTI
jgi:hypothetical protein